MKKLFFLAIALTGMTLISCSKDQAAVKKLDGNWTVNKMETTNGGITTDFIALGGEASMTFVECKLKKDEWCTGSVSTTILGITSTDDQVYRVTGDGTTLEAKDDAQSSTVTTITITSLDKTSCTLTEVDGNTTVVTEMTKN